MTYLLKFVLQAIVWFVALVIANNVLDKVWNKLMLVKPWKLKKA